MGTFCFHDAIAAVLAEVLVSEPMFNFASAVWLAGMQTSLHSSHEMFAFKSSRPAGKFEASVSGTSSITSLL